MTKKIKIAVVIPCYKVRRHILEVINKIPPVVQEIYCIDDACPENTADLIEESCSDKRIKIIRHKDNQGVGGAVMSGYRMAMDRGCAIAIKIDGDGQMDPSLIYRFINPILSGRADYTKGNRFFTTETIKRMPLVRLIGNAILGFFAKFSTGYWSMFDSTNGYTAIHLSVLEHISLEKISKRYFFESDLLFRLNIARCVVQDIPMGASYGNEESSLEIKKILLPFVYGHTKNFIKRIGLSYFIKDFNLASLELIFGLGLGVSGSIFGLNKWIESIETGIPTTAGAVMIAGIQLIASLQLILSSINYDMNAQPKTPLHLLIAENNDNRSV